MSSMSFPDSSRGAVALVVIAALGVTATALVVGARDRRAAKAIPAGDAEAVIARVPARGRDRRVAAIEQLERRRQVAPGDVTNATRLAALALAQGQRAADPRLLGRAQAALAPWWLDRDAPAAVLSLRATIKQSRHQFDAALLDLDLLLAQQPTHAQALLTKAVVLTVRGRYQEAIGVCNSLWTTNGRPFLDVRHEACAAPARAALGDPRGALATLERAIARGHATDVSWGMSVAGEVAFWAGELDRAAAHLRTALGLDPSDRYSRALLADVLLDAGRPDDVRGLLVDRQGSEEADEAALLRLALAEKRSGGSRLAAVSDRLRAGFVAGRRRGDFLHAREEARWMLEVKGDARSALPLALESWDTQREPWDARLVLAASAAIGDAATGDAGIDPATAAQVFAVEAFVRARGAAWRQAVMGAKAAPLSWAEVR